MHQILIIGKKNCSNCEEVKTYITNTGFYFVYQEIEKLDIDEQTKLKKQARDSNILSFPLIFFNGEIIRYQDLKSKLDLKITKRNGNIVNFDKQRIINAINNAMFETGNIDEDLSKQIAIDVENEIIPLVNVEEVQDIVEDKLMESSRKDVAKRYILYRTNKATERLFKKPTNNILLTDDFISKYKHIQNPMTPLGSFVYYRTYSRWIPELNRREYWWETVRRAVEYNASLANTSREEAELLYDNIFNLRQFLSGRTLFTGGSLASLKYPLSNFNCALRIIDNFNAFGELFYVLMLGTGCGVRVLPEDVEQIPPVKNNIEIIHKDYTPVKKSERQENTSLLCKHNTAKIIVGDSKEGWKSSLDKFFEVLSSNSYRNINSIIFDYDNVRPKGERLNTFGGRASGHNSVKEMFKKIEKTLSKIEGEGYVRLRPIDCLDICNIVGENVVSGGVRRTSEVGVFDKNDKNILNAKTNLYKQVEGKWIEDESISHRKMSNNSIYYTEKPSRKELHKHLEILKYNGEPGFINAEAGAKRRDRFNGLNPCCEILLDNQQTCNLTTINVMSFVNNNILDKDNLFEAQKLSVRAGYRMTCTELEMFDWDLKQKRDRLLGCSLTGWQDMVNATSMLREEQEKLLRELRNISHLAMKKIAKETGGNESLLVTSVKPEGTLSLLPTVSSGVHYSHSPYFIRRVRITSTDPLIKVCEELGYPIHPEVGEQIETCKTKVIEFPVKAPQGRTKNDVSAIEQLENYKMFMDNYVDHNVSITVTVRENEWDVVEDWLWHNWDSVVAVSFLPLFDSIYPLLPFEDCTKEEYEKRVKQMKPFNPSLLQKYEKAETEDDLEEDAECATGVCGVR